VSPEQLAELGRLAYGRVFGEIRGPVKPVCPVCSSSLVCLQAAEGYECGHCDARFPEPVEGCPASETGEHDEAWMNDGVCRCGADGSQSA
jgi:hypothetical protein